MLPPGTVFAGRYEILRTISAGGMGTVYEAMHRETRRRRALKVMLPNMLKDADLRRRFALEAQVTADVECEHIVETFDAGVDADSGSPFLVMELLRGEDLGARLNRMVRLPPAEVVGLLRQAAEALDKTHAAGIVHRDLKPENLFAVARDGTLRLKLLDFGIAKVVRQTEVGKATRSMGTPLYMSPEQFDGEPKLGPGVDLYALAHIAFTLLVGEAYWTEEARSLSNALALMKRVADGPTEAATTRASRVGVVLPAAFDGWFMRAAAKEPERRYASGEATIVALAEALGVRAALTEPVLGTVPITEDNGRRGGVTPDGISSRDVIGSQTTQAEPERETPGAAGGTRRTFSGTTASSSKARLPIVAAIAILSIGTAYLLLRDGPAPSAPSATSSAPVVAAPPPTRGDDAGGSTVRPADATSAEARATDPAPPSAAASASAPPPSARPRAPGGTRPTPPTSAAPPPPAPATAAAPPPPSEPWRTR